MAGLKREPLHVGITEQVDIVPEKQILIYNNQGVIYISGTTKESMNFFMFSLMASSADGVLSVTPIF